MRDRLIQSIVDEIQPLLTGRAPGKIFQLGPSTFAIDFGLRKEGYLLLSVEPSLPRVYLIKRRVRDLEKQGKSIGPFAMQLRKELMQTTVSRIVKQPDDRIVRFVFSGTNELGQAHQRTLVVQLTGRSANLILLDEHETIIQILRSIRGQDVGAKYLSPDTGEEPHPTKEADRVEKSIVAKHFASHSEAADAYFTALADERAFNAAAAAARADLRRKISRQQKLLAQLRNDLASHREADQRKRIGDLLLANLGTAKRTGERVALIDYFDPSAPTLEIQIDERSTLQEEAARRFALYQKSKRAVGQIERRIESVNRELDELLSQQRRLEDAIVSRDTASFLAQQDKSPEPVSSTGRPRSKTGIPGTRRYISSDGLEILVGRTASDNDRLTFKFSSPNDMWLHAADYGGSHVVVRNPTRKDLPHRTLIEAAQLAGYFSQARKDHKVDVHYTQRKFVSKPKRAAPGLVRLMRFKNITVEPKESVPRS